MDPKIRNELKQMRKLPVYIQVHFFFLFDNLAELVSKASVTPRERRSISAALFQKSPLSKWLFSTPGTYACITIQMLLGTQHKHLGMTRTGLPSETGVTVHHQLFMIPKS